MSRSNEVVRVLIVEDELVAARAHAAYTNRISGFRSAAVVGSSAACLRRLAKGGIDLVVLDLRLPDSSGLELYRRIRYQRFPVDVIVVSSALDADLVRGAVTLGAVQYIIKPFTFAAFRDKLLAYADFRHQIAAVRGELVNQAAVDRVLSSLHAQSARSVPKGLSGDTLDAILAVISEPTSAGADAAGVGTLRTEDPKSVAQPAGLSASAVATAMGASRITARRYLEYLANEGLLVRSLRYGAVGRPEALYRPAADRGRQSAVMPHPP